ncbi:hypothetical protein H0H92_003438 [Tricholoma furcatifolium]|nr:hypothetical protein H0H92_003438 [Tricholoma furcatifolium]
MGTLHRRNYFYVGAQLVQQDGSTVAAGQMYVEHLTPEKVTQAFPIVMIPGQGMTGTNFLNTPDGRLGWADYFLSKGYEVYLAEQPSRGRSSWQKGIDGPQSIGSAKVIQSLFTATSLHKIWPQASLHTQWPGKGTVGDPSFDAFYASIVPSLDDNEETAIKMKAAGSALLDKIGVRVSFLEQMYKWTEASLRQPVILLTHSQSGQHGWILADARPSKVKAIVSLEPSGPPFSNAIFPNKSSKPPRPYGVTDIPITYDPPVTSPDDIQKVIVSESSNPRFTCYKQASPPRQLVNLAHIPVLIVTSEAGYHCLYDGCTAEYLKQAGVPVDHINLADVGIHGNGHMMFMEKNSLQIADEVVENWLNKQLLVSDS